MSKSWILMSQIIRSQTSKCQIWYLGWWSRWGSGRFRARSRIRRRKRRVGLQSLKTTDENKFQTREIRSNARKLQKVTRIHKKCSDQKLFRKINKFYSRLYLLSKGYLKKSESQKILKKFLKNSKKFLKIFKHLYKIFLKIPKKFQKIF